MLALRQLLSERLILRPPSESDAAAVTDACQDPEISRFIPLIPSPYVLEDAVEFLRHVERQCAEADPERTFAIDDRETGVFLGFVLESAGVRGRHGRVLALPGGARTRS